MRKALVVLAAAALVGALSACGPKAETSKNLLTGQWGAVGGKTVTRADAEVKGTRDKAIYLTERYSMSAYRIPLENGAYTVKLHFAETYAAPDSGITDAGQRVFSVSIEGKPVLADFDPFKEAGKQTFTAIVRSFPVEVADGELTIEFQAKVQNAMIDGIEVLAKGSSRAVLRINCGATEDTTDSAGQVWRKDQELPAQ